MAAAVVTRGAAASVFAAGAAGSGSATQAGAGASAGAGAWANPCCASALAPKPLCCEAGSPWP